MIKIISFSFLLKHTNPQWHNDKYHYDLEYEGHFQIVVDGELFFDDPYFLVLEFLKFACQWLKKTGNHSMRYNSIETEDNPLISFLPISTNEFMIHSPWQHFECNRIFTKEQLAKEINDLKNDIEGYVN